MKSVVGANLHAFGAADTTSQKIGFVEGAGRAEAAFIFFGEEGGSGTEDGKDGDAGG